MTRQLKRSTTLLRRIARDTGGMAFIEFAYALPIFLGVGFAGVEITNLAIARMRISQLGMAVGDNAARVGVTQPGVALKRVFESDVYDIFEGARLQGAPLLFRDRGRVILSSLQQNTAGGQWIAWQRCYGNKSWGSSYGTAGTGKTGTGFTGMGPAGQQIQAAPSNAVMFVEIAYDYKPVVQPFAQAFKYFGLNVSNQLITYKSAFIVRDSRQLGDSNQPAATAANDFGLLQNTPALTRLTC
jgi:hypothetical protein